VREVRCVGPRGEARAPEAGAGGGTGARSVRARGGVGAQSVGSVGWIQVIDLPIYHAR
jgi:hypothetical protein